MNKYMQLAIDEARYGIRGGYGGPFGAVVVRDGVVIGRGHNRVLGSHDLSGCDIYTTGEPCHMCLCACLWANIRHVYYGCTIKDNALIGFRDDHFNDLFAGRDKLGDFLTELDRDACLALFDEYRHMPHEGY